MKRILLPALVALVALMAVAVAAGAGPSLDRFGVSDRHLTAGTPVTFTAGFSTDTAASLRLQVIVERKDPISGLWREYARVQSVELTYAPGSYTQSVVWSTTGVPGTYRAFGFLTTSGVQVTDAKWVHHIGVVAP